jgi:uncharacterized membrane protein
MNSPVINRAIFIFSLLGLLIAGYLWWSHSHPQDIPCGGSHGCHDVALSPYSRFPVGWGPPVAMYGTIGYFILLVLAVLRTLPRTDARERVLVGLGLLVAAGGTAFSLYLTYAEAFLIKAWCKWCVGSQFIILIILALTAVEWFRARKGKVSAAV